MSGSLLSFTGLFAVKFIFLDQSSESSPNERFVNKNVGGRRLLQNVLSTFPKQGEISQIMYNYCTKNALLTVTRIKTTISSFPYAPYF